VLALLGATLTIAAPLAAQGPGVFEVLASRKQRPTDPLLGGISLAHYHGPIGLRFSGALNLTSAQDTLQPMPYRSEYCRRECGGSRRGYYYDNTAMFPSIGAWSADADLIFAPVRPIAPLRALLLGFSPYAFAGVGGYGARPVNAPDTTHATWSVGAGAHHELLGWLGIGAEARYRQPFTSDSVAFGQTWRDKLEYRVGLTVSFGGRHRAAPAPSAAPEPEGAPCGRVPCAPDGATATVADPRFASRILDVADGLVGKPYTPEGTTPRDGFDAAGFVRYVFGQQGVSLPPTVREMASIGTDVPTRAAALRPGDLLFFANDGTNVNHVAIYAGRDRIIHSTATGNGVRYDTLGEGERGRWFADHLVSARRIAAAAGSSSARDDAGADHAPPPQGGTR
jgi:cell wall-associated NlpC family hydrolase